MKQSLNLRKAEADNVPVLLTIIDHPDLIDGSLCLSTDNADEISLDPYTRGTRSTFGATDGVAKDFYHVAMEQSLPDEEDGSEVASTVVIDVLDSDIVGILTGTIEPARCKMALVMSKTPNVIEMSYSGLQLVGARGDWGQVSLQFSMKPLLDEPVPYVRFSQERFPGMFE